MQGEIEKGVGTFLERWIPDGYQMDTRWIPKSLIEHLQTRHSRERHLVDISKKKG